MVSERRYFERHTPAGWEAVDLSDVRPGDIIRYDDSEGQETFVVESHPVRSLDRIWQVEARAMPAEV